MPLAFFSISVPIIFLQGFFMVIMTNNIPFDVLPIFLIGIIEVILRIYMVSLLATFFSKVYLIVTKKTVN